MKVCPNCQHSNPDDSVFCPECGTSLVNVEVTAEPAQAQQPAAEQPAEPVQAVQEPMPAGTEPAAVQPAGEAAAAVAADPEQPAGKKNFDLLAWIKSHLTPILLVFGVLIVILVLTNAFKPSKYTQVKNSVTVLSLDEKTVVAFDNKKTVEIEDMRSYVSNVQQTALLYTDSENSLYYLGRGDKEGEKIASNVASSGYYSNGFGFMYDGKTVWYVTDEDALYTVKAGKTNGQQIATDVELSSIVRSPNGKYIAYVKEDGYYVNDERIDLDPLEATLVGLSNNRLLYYNKDGKLYVQKIGGEAITLGEDSEIVMASSDLSEVLYTRNESTYWSRDGKEGVKVVNKEVISPLLPKFSAASYELNGTSAYVIVPNKSMINQLATDGEYIFRIGKNEDKTVRLVKMDSAQLATDGNSMLFYKNDKIYITKSLNKEIDVDEGLNRDVEIGSSVAAAADLSRLYFISSEDDLYYIKGTSKPKRVTSDVSAAYISFDNKTCFLIKDGELYSSSSGGKAKKVTGVNGNVQEVTVKANCVIVETDEAYYRCTGGTKFTQLAGADE